MNRQEPPVTESWKGAMSFNALVVLYLMAQNRGFGEYMITINGRRIVAVRELGKKQQTKKLVEESGP